MQQTRRFALRRPARSPGDLVRTWFFRVSGLAFIVMATPILDRLARGSVGFVPLVGLSVLAGLMESSFNQTARAVAKGIRENKLLVLFALWYLVGVILNALFRGNGLDDWRLLIGPVIVVVGIFYAFAFLYHDNLHRIFLVCLLLTLGVQTAISIPELTRTTDIVREMWYETGGEWFFGSISFYATLAVLFPLFVWRALAEKGLLRILLLAACISVFVAIFVSSLATPVALLVIAGVVAAGLPLLRPIKGIGRAATVVMTAVVLATSFGVYHFVFDDPLFGTARSRLENFLDDPVSGGYEGDTVLTASRVYLAEISIRSFRADPFFGRGGGNTRYSAYVGGHSSMADTLGSYGLLGGGGALLGLVIVIALRSILRFWREQSWESLLALASVILLVVAGIVDPFWEGWLPMYVIMLARPFVHHAEAEAAEPLDQLGGRGRLRYRRARWERV